MTKKTYVVELTNRLADKGLPIEAGWVALRHHSMSPHSSAGQVQEMRMAYMSGAVHVFSCVMEVLALASGNEDADMSRLQHIDRELRSFSKELDLRLGKPKGKA